MNQAIVCFHLAAGCGKGLSDLGTFPCANDATCPASYLCLQGSCLPQASCDPASATACAGSVRGRCVLVASGGVVVGQCVDPQPAPLANAASCPFATQRYGSADPCGTSAVCYSPAFVDGTGDTAACRRYCRTNGDCVAGVSLCAAGFEGPLFTSLGGLGVCLPGCDVFNNSCQGHCDAIAGVGTATAVPTCRADGPSQSGEICAATNCAHGLVCVPDTGGPHCRVPCDNNTHRCAIGTCNLSSFQIQQGTAIIGICQ